MIILGIIRAQLFLTISNSFIDSFRTKKSKTNNRSAMFIPEFTLIQKCRLSYFLTVAMTAKVQLGRGHQRVSGSVAKIRGQYSCAITWTISGQKRKIQN